MLLLCSFKEQLQQHVRVHAMEAVMTCWELEQSLQTLTGNVLPKSSLGDCYYQLADAPLLVITRISFHVLCLMLHQQCHLHVSFLLGEI